MTNFLDRLLGRTRKAVYGGPMLTAYQTGSPLTSLLGTDSRTRMAAYLRAYGVGWFYKAGSKISRDVAGLAPLLAYEDAEGDNEEKLVAPANNVPFAALSPTEQFLRLMERPNPKQTGKRLRQQTQIRLDFAGAAFWYLDGGDAGLPTAIYGINPARMEPSVDTTGNLIGWVMDRGVNGQKGIPFTAAEILPFATGSAGDDWYGMSVVEAVYSQVPLTDMIARHTADVLTTGGRLAGMMWPKDRALDETEFQEAARAWRNVASDPNAARRMLLFPEPMEYAAGAATPKDIGIPELAKLNREEITTAFPVNPYMLGLPLEPGMNSGESLQYVQRDYWRNTIHDRAELIEETIQVGLVPRYEAAIGRPLDFDLEEPDLDDGPVIVEKAGALRSLISLGFDPKAAISKVGLDDLKWNGMPVDPTPAENADGMAGPRVTTNDTNLRDRTAISQVLSKSYADAVKVRRAEVLGETLPGFTSTMTRFFATQRERLADDIARVYAPLTKAQKADLPGEWWDGPREDRELSDTIRQLYVSLSRSALTVVANDVDRMVLPDRIKRVTEAMLASAGERITGINETTRQWITEQLATGVQRGYSLNQMLYGKPDEGFPGIRNSKAFDAYRAELIARTETMRAYNESALRGYREYSVETVIASDGDKDDQCAQRNGRSFPVDEAMGIADHPNGTLDWIPVVPERGKSWSGGEGDDVDERAVRAIVTEMLAQHPEPTVDLGPVADAITTLAAAQADLTREVVAMKAAPPPAPVVNVEAPVVNVEAPVVNPTPVSVVVDNVRVTSMPERVHKVIRDKAGKPTGSVETDV